MNKKMIKKVLVVCITITIFLCNTTVFATSGLVGKFNGGSQPALTQTGENLIVDLITPILSGVRIFATAISIIMITFLGIKYMTAAPSEKANIKTQLITFTIGAIVVVATTSLLDIIKNFATNNIVTT